jgi:hypothetical protein
MQEQEVEVEEQVPSEEIPLLETLLETEAQANLLLAELLVVEEEDVQLLM